MSPVAKYKVVLIIETEQGNPKKWNFTDMLGDFAEVIKCDLVCEICSECGGEWKNGCQNCKE